MGRCKGMCNSKGRIVNEREYYFMYPATLEGQTPDVYKAPSPPTWISINTRICHNMAQGIVCICLEGFEP
jgi:hypothetical protein